MTGNIVYEKDHWGIAQDYLLQQYKNRPKIRGLLEAIIKPIQGAEDKLNEMYRNYSLSEATGYYLDRIGDIIGEHRNYRKDDQYKLAILVRIICNNGGGTPEEILTILRSIYELDSIHYSESGIAYFQIHLEVTSKPTGINQLVEKLKPICICSPTIIHSSSSRKLQFAEYYKGSNYLQLQTDNGSSRLNPEKSKKKNNATEIDFGRIEHDKDALGFGEIILNHYNLVLDDLENYLVKKKTPLDMIRSHEEYKLKGGGSFAEVIANE